MSKSDAIRRRDRRQLVRVPTISLRDLTNAELPEALARRSWTMLNDEAYFLLTDVGAAFPHVDAAWDAIQRYFAQPPTVKLAGHIAHSVDHHGYVPMGEEGKTGDEADYKESFDCGWYPPTGPAEKLEGHWPDVAGFSKSITLVRHQMRDVAERVARLLSRMLGEDEDYLSRRAQNPPSQLRLLHYPGDDPTRVGVDWHTDYECFTLLMTTRPGLEVRRVNGTVVRVPFHPDSLVVTLGDLMEVMTNGGLRASDHGVYPLEEERYSIAYFYALDWSSHVRPLPRFVGPSGYHYPEVVAGEHLLRRTDDGFGYRRASRTQSGESSVELSGPMSPYFYVRESADTDNVQ